jgi:hypothetical protein
VPDELLAQGGFDHACMHALDQFTARKFYKRATEGGLTGQRKTQIKAAQPAQFAVSLQAIYQRLGGFRSSTALACAFLAKAQRSASGCPAPRSSSLLGGARIFFCLNPQLIRLACRILQVPQMCERCASALPLRFGRAQGAEIDQKTGNA